MASTTPATFTVTVKHKEVFYDVEVTPLFNGAPIQRIGDRLTQWTEAEKTHKVFSRTIQDILVKSKIPDDHLTKGLLTVGRGRGISLEDRTQVNDDETKKVCDTFIRYLDDPDAGKDALPALDDADSIDGPGFTMKIAANVYLQAAPEIQKAARLGLFKKKCQEYYGLPHAPYIPLEASCQAFLSKQRERSSRAHPSETEKQRLRREINEWYFLLADATAAVLEGGKQKIEEERKALGRIQAETQAAADKAAEVQSETGTDDEHLLSDDDDVYTISDP